MVEGGSKVIQSFLTHSPKLVDNVILTISPQFVGGLKGVSSLLPSPIKLNNLRSQFFGEDLVIQGLV